MPASESDTSKRARHFDLPAPERQALGDGVWLWHASCYVLVGGSDGLVKITARVKDNALEALALEPQGEFGGMVWQALGDSFVGLPLERAALAGLIERYQNAGIIPNEVRLQSLVTTLLRLRVETA